MTHGLQWDALTWACTKISKPTPTMGPHARSRHYLNAMANARNRERTLLRFQDAILFARGWAPTRLPPLTAEERNVPTIWERRKITRDRKTSQRHARDWALVTLSVPKVGSALVGALRPLLHDLTGYETWTEREQVADALRAVSQLPAWYAALIAFAADERAWTDMLPLELRA